MPGGSSYTIDELKGMVDGKTIAQWTQDWWTWVFQSSASANPLEDADGAFANNNNSGPVFFVAGTSGGSAERTFTVPAGKPLLIPLVNFVDTVPEATASSRASPQSVRATESQLLQKAIASVTNVFASVDGTAVKNPFSDLVQTSFFSMGEAREGTVATALGEEVGNVMDPSKAAGYWVMLKGLPAGQYTLNFGGSSSGVPGALDPFAVNVTDHITAV